ncbi:hypothetical protein FO440_22280 [Mucilaginibacter corticis]|uniref:Uncharacterized protein n=1 Tax=Mucilaginibacter corticis TaxID=2597670 RepID=A0A556M9H6_9SPHI|nr:hypothetical protein [Mucilaginibacter corticis]TSJ36559.1 hypothetical protein FO440_22280 [Mucilaginibacter corticis]
MAQKYYVHDIAQTSGDHEVHNQACSFLPNVENRTYLGEFNDCHAAVEEAGKYYTKVDGCYYCSRECDHG